MYKIGFTNRHGRFEVLAIAYDFKAAEFICKAYNEAYRKNNIDKIAQIIGGSET